MVENLEHRDRCSKTPITPPIETSYGGRRFEKKKKKRKRRNGVRTISSIDIIGCSPVFESTNL